MLKLIRTSFGVVERRYPPRSVLKEITLPQAVGVYAILLVLGFIEIFLPSSFAAHATIASALTSTGVGLVTGLCAWLITTWVLNRYAREHFSLAETFVLYEVLTAGSGFLFAALELIGLFMVTFFSSTGMLIVGGFEIAFAIYMLIVIQNAVSSIASITKSQAAFVIISPLCILFAASMVLLILAGFVSTFM